MKKLDEIIPRQWIIVLKRGYKKFEEVQMKRAEDAIRRGGWL